jgi:beta-glucosidase
MVDALLESGIRPFCTMYQWDLPQALEDKGGWPNRDLANFYADYAAILGKHLGDRITVWAPFNMPWTFAYLGYGAGPFPPGKADSKLFLRAAHTISLAQSQALRALKAASPKATPSEAHTAWLLLTPRGQRGGSCGYGAIPRDEQRLLPERGDAR